MRLRILQLENRCRVGKGRPAGSNELRVSPSPSKTPYAGFSPVRLQSDRQWRTPTTSQGLSAVHIRPINPPYLVRWTGLACRLPYPCGPEECK